MNNQTDSVPYKKDDVAGGSIAPGRQPSGGVVEVRTVTRLSREVYERFEKSLPAALIDRHASDAGCDASFKLGIQYVLQKLRTDLVVE